MSQATSAVDRLRAVGVGAAVGVSGLLVGIVLVVVAIVTLYLAGVDVEARAFLYLVVSLLLIQGVAFGGVALAYLRYRGVGLRYVAARRPSLRDVGVIVAGWPLALAGAYVGLTLVTSTGAQPAGNEVGEIARGNPDVLLLLIPASFLLIGPGEELLFRGVVQGRIRETFGPVVGVGLASAIFAAIHFTALGGPAIGQLATIGVLFFPSVVFGTAYELTDNIVVPAMIHGAYNATLFGILYIGLRVLETNPAV